MATKWRFDAQIVKDALCLGSYQGSNHAVKLFIRVACKKSDIEKLHPGFICTKDDKQHFMTFDEIMNYVGIDFIMTFQDILESKIETATGSEKIPYINGLNLMNQFFKMACEDKPEYKTMKFFN